MEQRPTLHSFDGSPTPDETGTPPASPVPPPTASSLPARLLASRARQFASGTSGSHRSGKILIVDDHQHVRELLRVTLEVGPYELLIAEDGEEALDIAQREQPDLMLLDVTLNSSLDGYEVCRRIKGTPATEHTSVVMVTARGQAQDRARGEAAGADRYLVKPFSPIELLECVEELMAGDSRQ